MSQSNKMDKGEIGISPWLSMYICLCVSLYSKMTACLPMYEENYETWRRRKCEEEVKWLKQPIRRVVKMWRGRKENRQKGEKENEMKAWYERHKQPSLWWGRGWEMKWPDVLEKWNIAEKEKKRKTTEKKRKTLPGTMKVSKLGEAASNMSLEDYILEENRKENIQGNNDSHPMAMPPANASQAALNPSRKQPGVAWPPVAMRKNNVWGREEKPTLDEEERKAQPTI